MRRTYRRPKSRRKLARIVRQMRRGVTFACEPVVLSWETWRRTLASLGILVSVEAGR